MTDSKCKKRNEPVLNSFQILKEHPFEIKQEDEVPELAAAISGAWHLATPPLICSILVPVISQR